MEKLKPLFDAIVTGDARAAAEVTREAIAEGNDPMKLVQDFMIPAMTEVGFRFECREYFVPELLLSGRAMKASLEFIRPLLSVKRTDSRGCVVIGTVKGDLHDIGKNLVASTLEGAGFDVVNLGVDVAPAKFVQVVREKKPTILALSALLTTTMTSMETIIKALETAGLRDQTRVIVGGSPITREFAVEIGADGYGENATAAVRLAKRLATPANTPEVPRLPGRRVDVQ